MKARHTRTVLDVRVAAEGVTPTGAVVVRVPGRGTVRGQLAAGSAALSLPKFFRAGRKTLTVTYLGSDLVNARTVSYTLGVVRP